MVIKVTSTWSYLTPERGDWKRGNIMKRIKEDFKVKYPGASYSPKFQSGKWDGKIMMVDWNGRFRTGLLASVVQYLKQRGIAVTINKEVAEVQGGLVTKLNEFELREWQETMIERCIKWKRGIVSAATNSGKSFSFPFLIQSYGVPKTLVISNRLNIFAELLERLNKLWPGCGVVNDKECRTSERVTVAMQKSLLNRRGDVNLLKYLDSVELLIVDECHWACGKQYVDLIERVGAYHKFGFSGTPFDGKNAVEVATLVGLFGPEIYRVSNTEMIDRGQSRRPVVRFLYNSCELIKYYKTSRRKNITESFSRAGVIEDLSDKKCLIVCMHKEHGELLAERLKIDFTHSSDKGKNEKIERFKKDFTYSLISTFIIGEGVNLYGIDRLVYAAGGKSPRMIKQAVGRGLRKDSDVNTFEVVDVYDADGGVLEEHSNKRIGVYKSEGFEVILPQEIR